MNFNNNRIARLHQVQPQGPDQWEVTAFVGDIEHVFMHQGAVPIIGDIYKISDDTPPRLLEKISAAEPGAWNLQGDAMRWRKRDTNGRSRMERLRQRHIIRRAVRDYMDSQNFLEIDTPLLVHGTTPDAMIQSFPVGERYLITSSELQLRRLEIGGFERVYTLTPNFRRDDGEGLTHNAEFTMLEWVRVGEDLAAIERDTENLVLAAHKALGGTGSLNYKGNTVDLALPWDRMTVADAMRNITGASLPDFSLASVAQALQAAGVAIHDDWKDDLSFLFALLMDHIQPSQGLKRPVFLHDWPAFQTSSALQKNPGVTERSELYIGGLEICNGFPSFTGYEEQKRAFEMQQQRRRDYGLPEVKLDEAYLKGMRQGLPPDTGMALGFDRLVMVLTDAPDIRSVLAFAWDEV